MDNTHTTQKDNAGSNQNDTDTMDNGNTHTSKEVRLGSNQNVGHVSLCSLQVAEKEKRFRESRKQSKKLKERNNSSFKKLLNFEQEDQESPAVIAGIKGAKYLRGTSSKQFSKGGTKGN